MIKIDFKIKPNGVPILSSDEIDLIAERLIADFDRNLIDAPQAIDVDSFIEEQLKSSLKLYYLSGNGSIAGMTIFNNGKITVYDKKMISNELDVKAGDIFLDLSLSDEANETRYRFTAMHEAAHLILHKRYHESSYKSSRVNIKCKAVDVEKSISRKTLTTDEDWIEWQADYLASCLLMPKRAFISTFQKILKDFEIPKEYIKIGEDAYEDSMAAMMPKAMAKRFNVSVKSAEIRINKLALIRGLK